MILSNTRAKLIWEPGQPWILHVDNQPVGEWTNCRTWECGIQGHAAGSDYRIDVVNR